MALTVDSASVVANGDNGFFLINCQIDFDSSYPTGGEDLSGVLSSAGVPGATVDMVQNRAALASGRALLVDPDNSTILVLDNSGAEISNGTDLSGMTNIKLVLLCH